MKLRWHLIFVALLAVAIGLAFLREPGFGDDLTYWMQALEVHERGTAAWERNSFHDLRWPVWGICWALQPLFGFSIASFYGEPLFYLTLGALISFVLGRRLIGSVEAGWAGAIGFLFHPLLDSVCYRPMPDLSEGVLGAACIALWWITMNAEGKGRIFMAMLATGVVVYITETNRVTGALMVPVLILNTLLFFRRRFFWLVGAGVVAAICYAGEAYFYHGLFGDWLHNIHANSNNVGNKGTEPIPVWFLPLRFADALFKGNPLAPVYSILALVGIYQAWTRLGNFGRVIVVWFVLLYLEFSCTPQPTWPIWPPRPLVRDADRFLAALAVPMSLLAVCGLWLLWELITKWRPIRLPAAATGLVVVLAMGAITKRERFDLGFVPEFRAYLQSLPEGTQIFTHEPMRAIALLCDWKTMQRLEVDAPNAIMQSTPELEKRAAQANEFWYARKLVWLSTRKALERGALPQQPKLGSYLDEPEREWTLVRLLAKGDTPDLIFYRRRTAETPAPQVMDASAPELQGLIPALPTTWNVKTGKREVSTKWPVPPSIRGKFIRLELSAASPKPEVFTLRLKFRRDGSEPELVEYLLKPYLHPEGGKDFFVFTIPPDAERCDFTLKFNARAEEVRFDGVRAIFEAANPVH